MSQVVYTNHLKQRAADRGISLIELNRAIRFPDKVIASQTSASKKHIKFFDSGEVIVVIKRQRGDWIAVSAWKNSKKHTCQQFFLEKIIEKLLFKMKKISTRRA